MNKKILHRLALSIIFILLVSVINHFEGDLNQTPKEDTSERNGSTQEVEEIQEVIGVSGEKAKVARVIDGDTVVLDDGRTVRYIGIDTPEITGGEECFSREAKNQNEELVLGKNVILEKDVSETDRYNRLLRYVYVNSPDMGQDIFVNEYLVREGYATVSTFPPDVKNQQRFMEAERKAREENKGLWGSCPL